MSEDPPDEDGAPRLPPAPSGADAATKAGRSSQAGAAVPGDRGGGRAADGEAGDDADGEASAGEEAATDGDAAAGDAAADATAADATAGTAKAADADGAADADKPAADDDAGGAKAARLRRRRLAILLAIFGVAIVAVAAILWGRHRRPPTSPAVTDGGLAAREAPRGPGLPGLPDGVRITGYVLDGSGAPIVGAEVTAEIERGVIDRALSTTPRVGPGSGSAGAGSAGGSSGTAPANGAPAGIDGAGPGPGSPGGSNSGGGGNSGGLAGAGSAGAGSASAGGSSGRAGAGAGSAAGSGSGAGSGSAAPAVAVALPTGADGRFAIEGLAPGRYRLRVTGAGLVPAEVRYVPVPSDEIRIVVSRQVRIDGVVTDGGEPVANATVGLRGEAIGGEIETRTDPRGEFHFPELPEGRYQIYAWQGALAARAVRLNRLGSGPFPPVELRFEPAAIVVGRVIDRDEGTGLIAAVELRPSGDDQAPRFARTGDDGVFRIEGVPQGRWIADAFSPGYTSPGGVEIDAGRGVPELALVRGATIEGRVLDGKGDPIEGATVRALTGEGAAAQELSAEVDQDRLRRYSGRMAVAAPASVVAPGEDPTFIPRGELGVTVGPIPPIPPPGAQVARAATIDPAAGGIASVLAGEPAPLAIEAARQSIWVTGPDGRYRIRGLPKGKTSALAVAAGLAEGRSRVVALEAMQVVTGIDVVLTPGTILFGRVTNQHKVPVIGAQVTARPELGAPIQVFAEGDGTYRIGPVSGKIELSASAFGHAEARRTIDLAAATGREPAEVQEDIVLGIADATLAGLLEDAAGATVGGAQIEVIGGAGDGRHAVVGADGTFSIDMLPEGPLRVRVRHPDYPAVELPAAATPGGKTTSRLKLPLGGAVEGALLDDHSGEPLGGLTISAAGPRGQQAEATAEASGRWRLGPIVPGRWKLSVRTPGYLPLARELDVPVAGVPGGTSVRDIRLELRRGALVGGTVRDARGNRLPGVKVTVQAADATGPLADGVTDAQGEFRVRDAPTGDLAVTATRGDARGSVRTTVRPGDEVLSLSIEVR
jgi:protocatechuate 3,4-dioxygenase beta subunit